MIEPALVEDISSLLQQQQQGDIESIIRNTFPGVKMAFCSTDDIQVRKPVKVTDEYEIYLYAGDHCLTLSNDYDIAHGVVIAEIEDEDD